MKKLLSIIFSFIVIINKVQSQCATCKAAAETSLAEGETSIASGINIGVLYMLGVLFFIFGVGVYVIWKHRNADGIISK